MLVNTGPGLLCWLLYDVDFGMTLMLSWGWLVWRWLWYDINCGMTLIVIWRWLMKWRGLQYYVDVCTTISVTWRWLGKTLLMLRRWLLTFRWSWWFTCYRGLLWKGCSWQRHMITPLVSSDKWTLIPIQRWKVSLIPMNKPRYVILHHRCRYCRRIIIWLLFNHSFIDHGFNIHSSFTHSLWTHHLFVTHF